MIRLENPTPEISKHTLPQLWHPISYKSTLASLCLLMGKSVSRASAIAWHCLRLLDVVPVEWHSISTLFHLTSPRSQEVRQCLVGSFPEFLK